MQRSNAEQKVGEEGRMERWRSHLLRNIVFKVLIGAPINPASDSCNSSCTCNATATYGDSLLL